MAFTDIVDSSTPTGPESLTQGDDRIREAKRAWAEFLAVDHESAFTGTQINSSDSGCHNKVTLLENVSDPTSPAGVTDYGILYTKLDNDTTQSELFWIDEALNILQITKGNSIVLDNNFLSNNSWLEGTNNAGDAPIGMIKINTSDKIEVGTDVEFAENEALGFVIENRTSDPGTSQAGRIWLRTDL